MDNAVVNDLISKISSLKSSFNSFKGSTFTDSVWYGKAATNASDLIDSKITNKIEDLNAKLERINEAINLANACVELKTAENGYNNKLASLDKNSSDYKLYSDALASVRKDYSENVQNIQKLCS